MDGVGDRSAATATATAAEHGADEGENGEGRNRNEGECEQCRDEECTSGEWNAAGHPADLLAAVTSLARSVGADAAVHVREVGTDDAQIDEQLGVTPWP